MLIYHVHSPFPFAWCGLELIHTHISRKWIWCFFFSWKFVQSRQLFPYQRPPASAISICARSGH